MPFGMDHKDSKNLVTLSLMPTQYIPSASFKRLDLIYEAFRFIKEFSSLVDVLYHSFFCLLSSSKSSFALSNLTRFSSTIFLATMSMSSPDAPAEMAMFLA